MRVIVAEGRSLIRACLRSVLEEAGGFTVNGCTADGPEALSLAAKCSADVVVTALHLPGLSGIEIALRADAPTRVLVLASRADRKGLALAWSAGAAGLALYQDSARELRNAVRCVAEGGRYLSPAVTELVGPSPGGAADAGVDGEAIGGAGALATLSSREREVLQAVAEGHVDQDIADRLDISIKTVHAHRRGVMNKLGLETISALTRFALCEGLIEEGFGPVPSAIMGSVPQ